VTVLRATGVSRAREAVFYLVGGPGQAATESAARAAAEHREIRRRQDIVLVDQRGTGGSNPLPCRPFPDTDLRLYLSPPPDPAFVRACREALEGRADLRRYGTTEAVEDLEDVRRALGYRRVSLDAGSYGTRVALVYLRRHPDRVRRAVLRAVTPPGFRIPLPFAAAGEAALRGLLARCASDGPCHAAFPELERELGAVLERLEREPARVEVVNPATGKTEEAVLTRGLFASRLHLLLFSSALAGRVPRLIHEVAGGDARGFGQLAADFGKAISDQIFYGQQLSVLCAEDAPGIDPGEARREAAGTFLGTARVDQLLTYCREWPRGSVPDDFHSPVTAPAETLLISGALDPATPPRFAEEVARHFPNARHIVIPNGSHIGGGPCVDGIVARFLAGTSKRRLETRCLETLEPLRFVVAGEP